MKKHILLIPVLCATCIACSNNSSMPRSSYNSTQSQNPSDQDLSTQVIEAIKYDTSISLVTKNSIQATTNNGEVTLSGVANSNQERDAVIRAANSVKGVKRVYSNITIAKSNPQSSQS